MNTNTRKRWCRFLSLIILVLSLVQHGAAADDTAVPSRGTKQDVIALVKIAVAYFKANGAEKAFAAFDDTKGKFVDRDLYVFVYDQTGRCLAHGYNHRLIGMNRIDEQDVDGDYYIRTRVALMQTHTSFWQDYKFSDPLTHKIQPKSSYCETTPDPVLEKVLICSGVYTVE